MLKVVGNGDLRNINCHKNKSIKNIFLKILGIVFFLFFVFFVIMHYLITPIIVKTMMSKIDEISSVTLNSAINKAMSEDISYDELINVVSDANGKILMLQANVVNINVMSRKIVENTYNLLFSKLHTPLQIPLGSFSGVPAFASLGPVINVSMVPYGNVFCTFKSEFVSVGINQTIHKIYLNIVSDISAVMPICKLESSNIAEAIICESVIIGEIPETYLVAESTSDLLNMVG